MQLKFFEVYVGKFHHITLLKNWDSSEYSQTVSTKPAKITAGLNCMSLCMYVCMYVCNACEIYVYTYVKKQIVSRICNILIEEHFEAVLMLLWYIHLLTLMRPMLESALCSRLHMLNWMLGRSRRCDSWRWNVWWRVGTEGNVVWRKTCCGNKSKLIGITVKRSQSEGGYKQLQLTSMFLWSVVSLLSWLCERKLFRTEVVFVCSVQNRCTIVIRELIVFQGFATENALFQTVLLVEIHYWRQFIDTLMLIVVLSFLLYK